MNDNKKMVHYLLKRVFDMDPVLKSMAISTSLNDDTMKILRHVHETLDVFKTEVDRFNEPTNWRSFTKIAKAKEWEKTFKMLNDRLNQCFSDLQLASTLSIEDARRRDFEESKGSLQAMCTLVIHEIKESTKSVASDGNSTEGQVELKNMLEEVKEIATNSEEHILGFLKETALSAEEKIELLSMKDVIVSHSQQCVESIDNSLKGISDELALLKDIVQLNAMAADREKMRSILLGRITIDSSKIEF